MVYGASGNRAGARRHDEGWDGRSGTADGRWAGWQKSSTLLSENELARFRAYCARTGAHAGRSWGVDRDALLERGYAMAPNAAQPDNMMPEGVMIAMPLYDSSGNPTAIVGVEMANAVACRGRKDLMPRTWTRLCTTYPSRLVRSKPIMPISIPIRSAWTGNGSPHCIGCRYQVAKNDSRFVFTGRPAMTGRAVRAHEPRVSRSATWYQITLIRRAGSGRAQSDAAGKWPRAGDAWRPRNRNWPIKNHVSFTSR